MEPPQNEGSRRPVSIVGLHCSVGNKKRTRLAIDKMINLQQSGTALEEREGEEEEFFNHKNDLKREDA